MIIKETLDGFVRHYSDQNLMIRKIGTDEVYSEAVDVLDFEYEETDMPIEILEATEDDMREALSILGVSL